MQIVRAPRPENHFTTYENALIRNSKVTLRARGLLMLLLSYPPNWRTDYRTLARQEPEGEHAIRSSLKELREAGYIVQTKLRGEHGRFVTTTLVYDTPQLPVQTCGDSPRAEEPGAAGPVPEDRRSYEEPTTKDLEEVGSSGDGDGLPAGSPLRVDRTKIKPKPVKKRRPLTPAERTASWHRFRTMDLEDLDDDINVRRLAFTQLEDWENSFEPDKWAQAMIDKGEWSGYIAGCGLGYEDKEVSA